MKINHDCIMNNGHNPVHLRITAAMFWSLRSTWKSDVEAAFAIRSPFAIILPLVIVSVTNFLGLTRISDQTSTFGLWVFVILGYASSYVIIWLVGPSAKALSQLREPTPLRYWLAFIGWITTLILFVVGVGLYVASVDYILGTM